MTVYEGNPDVLNLSPEQFKSILLKYPIIVVVFYSAGCGHCVAFNPIYSKFASSLHEINENIPVTAINAVKYIDFARQQNISGYPTIRFYSQDLQNYEDFTKERSVQSLMDELNQILTRLSEQPQETLHEPEKLVYCDSPSSSTTNSSSSSSSSQESTDFQEKNPHDPWDEEEFNDSAIEPWEVGDEPSQTLDELFDEAEVPYSDLR